MEGIRLKWPDIKKKDGKFYFRFSLRDGNRKLFTFGTYQEARFKLADLMKQKTTIKDGTVDYRITFNWGVERYLGYKKSKGIAASTLVRYTEILQNFKNFIAAKRPDYQYLEDVSPRDISDFVVFEQARGLAPKTINDEIITVAELYNILIDDEYLQANPVRTKKHKVMEKENPQPVFFTEDEINKILKLAKTWHPKINWYALLLTYFLTGARRNEIRFLTWDRVKLDSNPPYIFIDQTKTGVPRAIPLHPQLIPAFNDLATNKRHEKWVFPNSLGKPLSKDEATKQLKKMCKKLEIAPEKGHIHVMRKTFASLSKMKKLTDEVTQKIGGWKDINVMKKHYQTVVAEWVYEEYSKITYPVGE